MKKRMAWLVALCLGVVLLASPAAAKDNPPAEKRDCAPIVFVHGLGGWGEGTGMEELIPMWGGTSGSVKTYLEQRGYEAYAASVSPVSSAWDRACELYAHLTGTRTDYGEAHAKAYGHGRFGPSYEALGADWPRQPIHLIAHSFGGATARMFAQLCAEGSAEERAATPAGELSPLFSGKLGGRIISITTVSAPHNGTTALVAPVQGLTVEGIKLSLYSAAGMGAMLPLLNESYPFRLEQFGVANGAGPITLVKRLVAFDQSEDSSQHDLSVDGALAVNKGIHCQPDIYYFSYPADITYAACSGRVPDLRITPMLLESSLRMGQKRQPYTTPGGVHIDDAWLPNDGLVNTISAQYPFNEPHRAYDPANVRPGVWQVMPTLVGWDHIDAGGGMRLGGTAGTMEFYLEQVRILEALDRPN